MPRTKQTPRKHTLLKRTKGEMKLRRQILLALGRQEKAAFRAKEKADFIAAKVAEMALLNKNGS
jgi:hypothetical protein